MLLLTCESSQGPAVHRPVLKHGFGEVGQWQSPELPDL
jgi:hypothetical protein